ncbi:thiol reductant ABC exporter subunit CydD [Prosthecochloris sp. GSB1]|uniref:thiol reductant ABC exporter subunit CydD n=1 Tax=Prosthecochloris sp. GSB1 TaxID=281093 RepID=UPI000B8D0812|nr:thiol reductant ABC exporter subunit CydD [Prosthecochloris sp. GSB1]ASQ90886.1 thiol reductant ABC exporter subunit CydD [Prosthecochloris sp. GSB1]
MNLDRRLILLAREHPLPFAAAVLLGALGGALLIAQAALLAEVIDALFIEKSGLTEIMALLVLYAAASLLRAGSNWAGQSEANRGAIRVKRSLHERLLCKLASLGPLHARSMQSGKLGATLLKGVESLDPYFSQFIPQLALAVVVPGAVLATVFSTDLLSGFILLVTAPLIPIFMILIGKAAKKAAAGQWETLARMSGNFLDVLQGLTTLRLFGRSRERTRSISEISERFRHSTMHVLRVAFLSSLALELVGTISTAIIAVEIGLRLLSGSIAFKPAFFILLLTPDFYLPLRQLGTKFHAGMEGSSAAEEIFAILDRAENRENAAPQESSASSPDLNSIAFQQVSFTYPQSGRKALDTIDCVLENGTCTAVAGPSGAGKTTFVNLLLRFAEPDTGHISCGKKDLRYIRRTDWHAQISWVPQHPYLFNASLRENLLLAKPGASEKEVKAALESSRLEPFIRSLPNGLDTPAGERGARISGGEAQRLSLARAFLKNAPLVILDEPVSHTDPVLEQELLESMRRLIAGKTSVIIAHRLGTIEKADMILVFDNGRIVQAGTHRQLVLEPGFYREALRSFGEENAA